MLKGLIEKIRQSAADAQAERPRAQFRDTELRLRGEQDAFTECAAVLEGALSASAPRPTVTEAELRAWPKWMIWLRTDPIPMPVVVKDNDPTIGLTSFGGRVNGRVLPLDECMRLVMRWQPIQFGGPDGFDRVPWPKL